MYSVIKKIRVSVICGDFLTENGTVEKKLYIAHCPKVLKSIREVCLERGEGALLKIHSQKEYIVTFKMNEDDFIKQSQIEKKEVIINE